MVSIKTSLLLLVWALLPTSLRAETASEGILLLSETEGTRAVRGVLVGPQKIPWTRGFWAMERPERRGSLGIEVLRFESSSYGGEALVMEQGFPGLERLRVMRCAGGRCEPQKVEQKSPVEFDLRLGNLLVRVRDYGEACQEAEKGRCRYFLPSWALKALGKNPVEGLPQFPKVLLVRQTQSALEFYNAETGQPYHEMNFGRDFFQDKLGTLQETSFDDQGRMALQFERGAMLIDWVQDQLLMGDEEGRVSLSVGGLGGGSLEEMKVVHTPLVQKTLLIGSRYVVQKRQVLIYHLNHFTPFKLLETLPTAAGDYRYAQRIFLGPSDDEGASLVALDSEGQATLSLLNPQGRDKILEKTTFPKDLFQGLFQGESQKENFKEEHFYRSSSSGLEKLDSNLRKNQWEPVPLSKGLSHFLVVGNSFFGIRTSPTDKVGVECEWVRTQFPKAGEARGQEVGFLRFSCDGSFDASSSPDKTVMAWGYQKLKEGSQGADFSGEQLKVFWKVWWP